MQTRRSREERRRLRSNPKPLKPRKHVEIDERRSFLEVTPRLKPERRVFCEIIYYTGCRIQECHDLCPDDFNIDRSCISFECLKLREAGVFREVPVRPEWIQEAATILNLSQRDPYECVWDFSLSTGFRSIKSAMRWAGITGSYANARGLRHSFCTLLGNSKETKPNQLQYWAGHKNLKTTSGYIGRLEIDDAEAPEIIW